MKDSNRWPLRRLLAAIATIAGGTVLLKVLGFARDAGLAAKFGLGAELDAYNAAQMLPVFLVGLLIGEGGGRLALLFVPVYTEVRARAGREAAWRLTLTVFNLSGLVLAAAAVVMMAFPHLIVRMLPGFAGDRAEAAARMLVIMAATTVAMGLTGFMRGYLVAHGRYVAVTVAPAIGSLIVMLYVFMVAPRFGIEGVAWCTLGAAILPFLLQLPAFLAEDGSWRPLIDWKDPAVRRIGHLMVPVIFGLSLTQLGAMVDQIMASMLPPGHLSALTYANRLRAVPFFLVIMSTEQALFPRMSTEYMARGLAGIRDMGQFEIRVMTALTVPIVAGIIVLREPVARLAFGHGSVDDAGVRVIAGALAFYVVGLLATCITTAAGNAFFTLQETRTPTVFAAIALVVNIVGNLLLIGPMQANGIALATSASAMVYLVLCAVALRRRVPGLLDRAMVSMYLRVVAASAVMGAVCFAAAELAWGDGWTTGTTRGDGIRLAAVVAAGMISYGLAALAFRVDGVALAGRLAVERAGRMWNARGARGG